MSFPERFLNRLQRKLKDIGTETITFALMKRFHHKFNFLFLTPVYLSKYQVKQLTDCGVMYMECIRNYVVNTAILQQSQVEVVKKSIELVETLSNLKGMKKEFVQSIATTVFQTVTEPEMQLWFGKEMLRAFNSAVKYTNKDLRNNLVKQNFIYLCKFMDILSTCGDYDYEVLLMETIFRLCSDTLISNYASTFFPECEMLQRGVSDIRRSYFYRDVRVFLNSVNNKFKKVFSIKCDHIILGNKKVGAPRDHYGDKLPLWVDFNSGSETVTFKCDRDSLRTFAANRDDSAGGEWESITVESSNVKKVLIKRLLGPYYSAYSQGVRVLFSLTQACGVMCPSSLEVAQATHLKLSIYPCPELLQLEAALLSMYREKCRSLLEDEVNTMPRRKRSHACQSPEIKNTKELQEATAEVTHTLNRKSKENKPMIENSIEVERDDIKITKPPPAKRKCRLSISKNKDILKDTTFDNIIPLDLDTTRESVSSVSDLLKISKLSKDKSMQQNHDNFIKETNISLNGFNPEGTNAIDNVEPLDLDTTRESVSSASDLLKISKLSKDKSIPQNHDNFVKETNISLNGFNPEGTNAIDNVEPVDTDILPPTKHFKTNSNSVELNSKKNRSAKKTIKAKLPRSSRCRKSGSAEAVDNGVLKQEKTFRSAVKGKKRPKRLLKKDKKELEWLAKLHKLYQKINQPIDSKKYQLILLPTEDFETITENDSNSQVYLMNINVTLKVKEKICLKEIIKVKWPGVPRRIPWLLDFTFYLSK